MSEIWRFKHDELIDIYAEYLLDKHPYDIYYKKINYCFDKIQGEIDLLRLSEETRGFFSTHIYEFKSNDNGKSRTKALKQLDKIKFGTLRNEDVFPKARYYYARPLYKQEKNKTQSYLLIDEYKEGKLSRLEELVLK